MAVDEEQACGARAGALSAAVASVTVTDAATAKDAVAAVTTVRRRTGFLPGRMRRYRHRRSACVTGELSSVILRGNAGLPADSGTGTDIPPSRADRGRAGRGRKLLVSCSPGGSGGSLSHLS
ncbi:hypothetical protein GCM10010289_07910 [Streptomyces violascens]|uniref:Uncharacterized protein n=1 Tax=Streptomyces violascens TaxID=67381 RepID=A0ABQ3QGP6_9ACTN|nr:hypothetical protein GCM10010289_07910 [Streptomyces violascens]GHI36456.1 hypothetical protein Sviol_08640 [Streptomyces violascens]